jgi:hypothetical protein
MRLLAISTLCLLVAACGSGDSTISESEPLEETVFDPLTGTLDRAAGVQDTLDEAAAARRRQLEEQEGR